MFARLFALRERALGAARLRFFYKGKILGRHRKCARPRCGKVAAFCGFRFIGTARPRRGKVTVFL